MKIGTLAELDASERFDTILYIDVLEHIEDDKAELAIAARFLRPNGLLAVLSPAMQFLFSDFDRAIGHFRRYNLESYPHRATPAGMEQVSARYLDTVGLLASLGNRLLLKSAMPTAADTAFWDRVLVRMSRAVDPILRYRWGKSVLVVWKRTHS